VEKAMNVKSNLQHAPDVACECCGRSSPPAPPKAVLRRCTPEEANRLAQSRLAYGHTDPTHWRFYA
jgi:hypothetical protein